MNRGSNICDNFSKKSRFGMGSFFFGFISEIVWKQEIKRDWIDTRESFSTLIACGKPKSNDNGKYKRDWERKREWMEARVSRGSA